MKNLTRKILPLVLALMAMGILLTTALAANNDTLTLQTYPDTGIVYVSNTSGTPFAIIPKITNNKGNDVTDQYRISYQWTLNDVIVSETNYYEFPAGMDYDEYRLVCTVYAIHRTDNSIKTSSATWYPTMDNVHDLEFTVSEAMGTYCFTDSDTYNGTSVYDEICMLLNPTTPAELNAYSVIFTPVASGAASLLGPQICRLNDLDDVYLTIYSSGTWTAQYTVVKDTTTVLNGRITIEIEPYVGMDAFINALPGANAVIEADTFYNIWNEKTNGKSTLQSVYITSCSGLSGTLCYDHTSTEKNHTQTYGLTMYASPSNSLQKSIEDLTFVPSKYGNKYSSGTVTVNFQANGRDQKNNLVSVSGSIVIFYNEESASDITYDCNGTSVFLNSNDFDAVYRAVTGSKLKNPSYTVAFLNLPVYGTLYRNYSTISLGNYSSTALTKENVATLTFSSNSSGENSLDKLAYVPAVHTSAGDSATYIVYNGSQILYVGTVKFTSRELVVTYTTSEEAFDFSSMDFYSGGSPLLNAQYISFGTPSSGTLYKDYANGIRVQRNDLFSYSTSYGVSLLDNVTFVPSENFVGVVEIPFYGQSLLGGTLTGKVRIYVVRDVFEDVDPNSWAAPYINRLYASGIIKGTSDTTFSPNNNMKYGEALKMILIAAGYPKQSETGGTHWASNYLDLAYQKGIVSSRNINLNEVIDRTTVAEIAAKALGLEKASSVVSGIIGPVDSTNGYVYALYNAGILNGSFINGSNYFQGSNPLTRAEVAKIICAINDYKN